MPRQLPVGARVVGNPMSLIVGDHVARWIGVTVTTDGEDHQYQGYPRSLIGLFVSEVHAGET